MRFELRLLGRFAASAEGEPPRLLVIPAPRRRALLAYLAMQPAYAESRERLADLLWGDRFDKQARQNLRQLIAQLKKDLEPAAPDLLIIERDTVGLRPEGLGVDARELLTLAASNDAGAAERGAALYRGPFLDGIDVDAEAFTEWLCAQRSRIAGAAARVIEAQALAEDRANRGAEAIAAAERLVALDPGAEPAHRLLIRLEARHRGRDSALARAASLAARLRTEVDASPDAETMALLDSIRRGEVESAPRTLAAPALTAGPMESPGAKVAPIAVSATARASPVAEAPMISTPPLFQRHGWAAAPFMRRRMGRGGAAVLGVVGLLLVGVAAYDLLFPARSIGAQAGTGWRSPHIPGAGVDRAALARQGLYAIVVLPFTADGESTDAEKGLADRITGDLINDLSRVPALRVISRATSRLYKDKPVDVAALGTELGVRYVVEGSVQRQGDRVRINIGLTDASSRIQVWSERFERPVAERFAVQDEIARGLARHLHVGVLTNEDNRRAPGTDPQIDDLLARGWASMLRISVTGTNSGADRDFEAVLKRDPDNVSALTGLGAYHASVVAMFLVKETAPHLEKAETYLARAVKLQPNASLPHYFTGILHKTRGRPQEALKSFTRTVELNPSFAPAYAQIGHVLSRIGRLPEALDHVRYAIRLSPKDPNLGLWSTFGGQIELELGNDRAAIDWLTKAAALDPRSPFIRAALAAAHMLQGDKATAAKFVEETRALAPWLTLERMIERLAGLSEAGHEPKRLLQGLRLAFAKPS